MADETTPAEDTAAEDTTASTETAPEETVDFWKKHSRKHERDFKKTAKENEDLRAEIEQLRSGQQTDQEKALEQARKEAREQALTEAQQERRNDRLEVAVARHAAHSFADLDDALLHVQRGITAGDIDADDIFDEQGQVQTEALKSALDEILERKPHLKADPNGSRPTGTADAGRGTPATVAPDEAHNDVLLQLAGLKR